MHVFFAIQSSQYGVSVFVWQSTTIVLYILLFHLYIQATNPPPHTLTLAT